MEAAAVAVELAGPVALRRVARTGKQKDISGPVTWPEQPGQRLMDGAAALAVVAWDFIYYWNHRFMHESRYMWAIHVVHHSSERYNLSTALRQPVADALGTFVPYSLLAPSRRLPKLTESPMTL